MPQHSRYKSAVLQDEEIADLIALAEDGAPAKPKDPDFFGWTPEMDILVGLFEAIQHLTAITVGVNSKNGKVPKVKPLPRPVPAIDRARLNKKMADLSDLIEAFRPKE